MINGLIVGREFERPTCSSTGVCSENGMLEFEVGGQSGRAARKSYVVVNVE